MKRLAWAVLFCPLFVAAQEHGIDFLKNVSWPEVLQKAKTENKYIFVDCYASWCGPCKWMEKDVYHNDTVGRAMNDEFLSVQIQMDTTQHDNEEIKNWYATAHLFGEQYQVNAYPSYLFFSPDGRLVHEDIGYKDINNFLALARKAMDPQQQYFTLLASYQKDNSDYAVMPYLAKMAGILRQKDLETVITQAYIQHLETLPSDQLWTRENLDFMRLHSKAINSGRKIFQFYYRDRKRIDSIMDRRGYSDGLINSVIYDDKIAPTLDIAIKAKSEPHWHRIERIIEKKYNRTYAEKNVLKGRMDFYHTTKEWEKYITYYIRWQEETSIPTIHRESLKNMSVASFLNYCAWEIFQYSKKKKELDTAISWTDLALSMSSIPDPHAMDTKANLLYKIGKKDEAIRLEEQSYNLANNDKEIQGNFEKMKNGLPTWP